MANKRSLGFSSTDFRKKFRTGMTVRIYRDNEVIFSQGDAADAVFYIQSGTVKLTVAATRRKKAIVAVLLRGSFFGEGCLGGQSLRIYTARSIGPESGAAEYPKRLNSLRREQSQESRQFPTTIYRVGV
jgi:CRP/FNR family cyclic AMP-dependent transcriptional regulator